MIKPGCAPTTKHRLLPFPLIFPNVEETAAGLRACWRFHRGACRVGTRTGQGWGHGCGWQVMVGAMSLLQLLDILEELSQDSAAEIIFS